MSEIFYVGASCSSNSEGARGMGRAVVVGVVAWGGTLCKLCISARSRDLVESRAGHRAGGERVWGRDGGSGGV